MNEEIKSYWRKLGYYIVTDFNNFYASNHTYNNHLVAVKSPLGHFIYYRYSDSGSRIPVTEQQMLSFIHLQAFK